MKQLILAEKPSVARDLSRILGASKKNNNYYEGKDVVVTWALGHLLGLKMPEDLDSKWQKWQFETLPMLPKDIGIKPLPKTKAQLHAISALAKRKDIKEAVIATDAGREGELVARWILEYVHFNKPVKRLWISSQTDQAVKEGFKNLKPAKQYDNLYQSALARAKADWLVGLNVTRSLTVKYDDNLSAGRVQTPTLALVRKQEEKIERFKPQTYYVLSLNANNQKATLVQKDPHGLKDKTKAQELLTKLQNTAGQVVDVVQKEQKKPAPLLYDLTELQRDANAKYGYSAKKTLSLVQSLYEIHKVVSYPRTDCKYLSSDIKASLAQRLRAMQAIDDDAQLYLKQGAKVVNQAVFNDAKISDHYALIPTEQPPQYAKFSNDEQRIYTLIAKRFLTMFAPVYRAEVQNATVAFGEAKFVFKQTRVLEAGWQKTSEPIKISNAWVKGQSVTGTFELSQALTQPPKPLSEGSLLTQMEKYSLGTPATRAEIIEKLVRAELMERQNNNLHVTPKGKQLLKLVNPSLVSPQLTAKWEQQLEAIAKGEYSSQEFLAEIKQDTKQLVNEVKNSSQKYQDFSLTQKKCPECGQALREKNTRDGKILVCSNQDCTYKRRLEAKESNHRCPQCHKKMLIMQGKNGMYFKCKYDGTTEKMLDKKAKNKKMTKHEERRLLKKINQDSKPQESALAQALKAALQQED